MKKNYPILFLPIPTNSDLFCPFSTPFSTISDIFYRSGAVEFDALMGGGTLRMLNSIPSWGSKEVYNHI